MRTLVVSDLHLGARNAAPTLHEAQAQAALAGALEGVGRLVLLGDTIELRHGRAGEALDAAAPALSALGAAMAGGEIVVVPGNHDHALAGHVLEDGPALSLEERFAPEEASPLAARVAELLAPAHVSVAYPGVWLRDDVYATHGHYLDAHSTLPTIERIAAGVMARLSGPPPESGARPADYEALLAPLYAWIHAAAQRVGEGRAAAGAGQSGRAWRTLTASGRRPVRARALAALFPLAVAGVNRAGLGPVRAQLDGPALRRGTLHGMHEALRRLGVEASHVVFGHTHRAGPLPGDDPAEWGRLVNSGSWLRDDMFATAPERPYWPGSAVEVGLEGPPVVRWLL